MAELLPQSLSLLTLSADNKEVLDCVVYHFTAGSETAQLSAALQQESLLQHSYIKTALIYGYPQSILLPNELYSSTNHAELLDGVYGDTIEGTVKTDFLYKQNLHNIYRIPAAVLQTMEAKLPMATVTHQYSLLVDTLQGDGDCLHCMVNPKSITLLLRKAGKLQVVQNMGYEQPETASWALLNACQCFGVAFSEVDLVLYGMIQPDSALYNDFYKYFLHIRFAELPTGCQYPAALEALPAHFFAHLINNAQCVL